MGSGITDKLTLTIRYWSWNYDTAEVWAILKNQNLMPVFKMCLTKTVVNFAVKYLQN